VSRGDVVARDASFIVYARRDESGTMSIGCRSTTRTDPGSNEREGQLPREGATKVECTRCNNTTTTLNNINNSMNLEAAADAGTPAYDKGQLIGKVGLLIGLRPTWLFSTSARQYSEQTTLL